MSTQVGQEKNKSDQGRTVEQIPSDRPQKRTPLSGSVSTPTEPTSDGQTQPDDDSRSLSNNLERPHHPDLDADADQKKDMKMFFKSSLYSLRPTRHDTPGKGDDKKDYLVHPRHRHPRSTTLTHGRTESDELAGVPDLVRSHSHTHQHPHEHHHYQHRQRTSGEEEEDADTPGTEDGYERAFEHGSGSSLGVGNKEDEKRVLKKIDRVSGPAGITGGRRGINSDGPACAREADPKMIIPTSPSPLHTRSISHSPRYPGIGPHAPHDGRLYPAIYRQERNVIRRHLYLSIRQVLDSPISGPSRYPSS